ncbi:MAG: hypothetical protein HUK20_06695 [Fibrobacter sp.]|nr:hypothetical protein [Fibrobacter sp.]
MIVAELEPVVAPRNGSMPYENFSCFGEDFPDGRLTESSSTEKHIRLHEAIAYSNSLGRPLTEEEMKQFEV